MRYSVIENGKVVNVVEADSDFAASRGWPENTGEGVGWIEQGDGTFTPPQPSLDDARDSAMTRVKQGHANAMSAITDRFPLTEREGWPILVKQAEAGTGGALTAYATALGVTESDASTRVLTASATTEQLYGQATGTLTALRDQVDAATDVATLQAIDWPE